MFLKRFLKPKSYNTYWTPGPGNIYQVDFFSISGLMRHIGFEVVGKTIKKPKGPWVLSCIDMYSRYLETRYIGLSNKMEYVIKGLTVIFMKMGPPLTIQADDEFNTKAFINFCNARGIKYIFWKPYENPKNQLIERANLTIKRLMLKYVDKYGWPRSGDFADDAQQVLDACTWYYNRIWHSGINAIPFEVFFGYDDNRQKVVINDYLQIPIKSIVLRRPYRKLSNVPLTVYQIDPEPFIVVAREGGQHVGKYQLRSLVTDELESRWYKPYELRVVHKDEYNALFSSPVLDRYILEKYGEQVYSDFYDNLPQKLASLENQ
jgi:hypothetical protein